MPVVPPMVSAATGALLVPHIAPGQARLSRLLACYAMFGLSLLASLMITTLILHRLAVHGTGPAATAPTMWIVLTGAVIVHTVRAGTVVTGTSAPALPNGR